MIYRRSGTALDKAGYFFPPKLKLSGLGQTSLDFIFDSSSPLPSGESWQWDDYVPTGGSSGGAAVTDPGLFGSGVTWQQAVDTVKNLWLLGRQAEAQDKLIELNIARARAGQPPLPTSYFTPGVNIGMTPQTQQLVTYGLIAAGVLFAVSMMSGGGRGRH